MGPNPSTTKAGKHVTKHVIIMDEVITEASYPQINATRHVIWVKVQKLASLAVHYRRRVKFTLVSKLSL